ncbi:MAG: DUF1801 domain-containing protein [Devosia sp.]
MPTASKPAKKATAPAKSAGVFSKEEKEAMKAYAAEKKAQKAGADGEAELLSKIAEMKGNDKAMAERIHAIVKQAAPGLIAKTWYGMPAYAREDGKAVLFYQPAGKFKARYSTLGFNDSAMLDDGNVWATSFALVKLDAADEKKIAALVKKAVS